MENETRYREAFKSSLEVSEDQLAGLEYQGIPSWDSVGHMELVAAIEDEFDIMMDTEDIIDFSSYNKGIEILRKYGIEL